MPSTRFTALILCLLALALPACDFKTSGPSGPNVAAEGARVGDVAADFMLYDRYGRQVYLSDYRGKVILLDISTMWCSFCKIQAEGAEEFYQQYRNRGFVILNVLFADANGAPITQEGCGTWSDFYGISFPVLADTDEEIWRTYSDQDEIPLNIVIDRDFVIQFKASGYKETQIRQTIENLL